MLCLHCCTIGTFCVWSILFIPFYHHILNNTVVAFAQHNACVMQTKRDCYKTLRYMKMTQRSIPTLVYEHFWFGLFRLLFFVCFYLFYRLIRRNVYGCNSYSICGALAKSMFVYTILTKYYSNSVEN